MGLCALQRFSIGTLAATIMLPLAPPAAPVLAEAVNLDNLPAGPAGWTAMGSGAGEAKWKAKREDSTSRGREAPRRPDEVTQPLYVKDGFVEATFRPISGREDLAGGLVWRAKDSDNYYLARANMLEGSVAIYYTVSGRRTEKKRASVQVASNHRHTLRVEFQGAHFAVICDGKTVLEWDDDTFKDAGKVGVWLKADSVTFFDDFSFGTR